MQTAMLAKCWTCLALVLSLMASGCNTTNSDQVEGESADQSRVFSVAEVNELFPRQVAFDGPFFPQKYGFHLFISVDEYSTAENLGDLTTILSSADEVLTFEATVDRDLTTMSLTQHLPSSDPILLAAWTGSRCDDVANCVEPEEGDCGSEPTDSSSCFEDLLNMFPQDLTLDLTGSRPTLKLDGFVQTDEAFGLPSLYREQLVQVQRSETIELAANEVDNVVWASWQSAEETVVLVDINLAFVQILNP